MKNFGSALIWLVALGTFVPGANGAQPDRLPQDLATDGPNLYNWSGFYGGVNGGHGAGSATANITGDHPTDGVGNALLNVAFSKPFSYGSTAVQQSPSAAGFVGGGQVGYMWQFNRYLVAGLEADIQFSNISGSSTTNGTDGFAVASFTTNQDLKWFGTVRARLGIPLMSDRLLVYATGGLAYGDTRNSATGAANFAAFQTTFLDCRAGISVTCIAGSDNGMSVGWTLGGGMEWALSRSLTLRAEYVHIDLGSATAKITPVAPATGTGFALVNFDKTFDIVRVGLNMHF